MAKVRICVKLASLCLWEESAAYIILLPCRVLCWCHFRVTSGFGRAAIGCNSLVVVPGTHRASLEGVPLPIIFFSWAHAGLWGGNPPAHLSIHTLWK